MSVTFRVLPQPGSVGAQRNQIAKKNQQIVELRSQITQLRQQLALLSTGPSAYGGIPTTYLPQTYPTSYVQQQPFGSLGGLGRFLGDAFSGLTSLGSSNYGSPSYGAPVYKHQDFPPTTSSWQSPIQSGPPVGQWF